MTLAAGQALASSKHFRISYEHFGDYSGKAADLYFKADRSDDKNILFHLTSIAALYAEKAHAVMNMVDVLEHMAAKRDRLYVEGRLEEIKRLTLASLFQDVKVLSDLVENQENRKTRELGTKIVNEMRVFGNNTENLRPQAAR